MGNFVREFRIKKGLSQFALAQKTGIQPPDISKIERGHISTIWPSWRRKLAEALETNESQLFVEEVNRHE